MKNNTKKAAIIAGISLIIMTLLAGFAYGYAHTSLFSNPITLDSLRTLQTSSLFTIEVLAWIIIFATDLAVAWGFYTYLKPAHHRFASLSGAFRLIYTLIFGVAIANLASIWLMVHTRDITSVEMLTVIDQRLGQFFFIWQAALIIIGGHLIFTGLATMGSSRIPRIWLYLLLIAGSGYVITSGIFVFMPNQPELYTTVNNILMLPMTIGEVGFGLWLLIKGHRVDPTIDPLTLSPQL